MLFRTSFRFGLLASSLLSTALAINACSSSTDNGGAGTDAGSSSGDPTNEGGGGGGEGGGGGDGGGGGGDSGGGDSGGNGCDSLTKICDDFDKGTTIDPKWTTFATGGSASIVTGGQSAPNALAIAVTAGGGGAYIEKALGFNAKVHCELDMKIEALPTQGDLDLFSLTTKTSTADYYVYFAASAAGFIFGEFSEQVPGGSSVDKKQPIAAPPTGSWFHVVFDNDGANATLTASGASSTLTALVQPPGASRNVQLGAPFAQSTEIASRVLYDNVVCAFGN